MWQRRRTILDDLVALPWWGSPLAALTAYLLFGYLIPSMVPADRPAFAGIKSAIPMLAPIAGLLLLLPMPFAYLNGRKKRRLIATNQHLDAIRALSWRDFEQLVAEAYRRKGYVVRENLNGGPDGGVDVRLERNGQLHLVQCKQWRAQKVGVSVVREMYGVMTAESAASAAIITSGFFTQDAKNFAEEKAIALVDGGQLVDMLNGVAIEKNSESAAKRSEHHVPDTACPHCGSELVQRIARRGSNSGKRFWGCSGFPECRYTRNT